ncbi:MAG TPA: hypothetical protein VNT53_06915 [Pseudolysinimonas sp.]|nr:hypothetical protein [Pseudolysinimonas sp.]
MSTITPDRTTEASEQPKKRGLTLLPKRTGSNSLIVGGPPRANLLPPEIILKRKQLKMRRSLRLGILLVAIATVAGCIGAVAYSAAAQVQLTIAQQQQETLVAEQALYAKVKAVNDTITLIKAGQEVGGSTEIQWRDYLLAVQGTLPAGLVLQSVSVDEGTPMTAFEQSEAPLQGVRVAELTFTAQSATLPSIPDWLRSLSKLEGFVDAVPGSISAGENGYVAQVVMHIDASAFSHRFDPDKKSSADSSATEGGN